MLRPILLILLGLLHAFPAFARFDAPAVMVIEGEIRPSALAPGISPQEGDRVLMFSSRDGSLVGHGQIYSRHRYLVAASPLAHFNGTPVVLELQHGRKRYALLPPGGGNTWFPYAGRTLPERTHMDWEIGPQTAELSPRESSTPAAQRLSRTPDAPCDARRDINGDGRCDEADWAILRLYGGGVSQSTP